MQAVKDYSSYSHMTIESVNAVAKDFYFSCLRTNSYKPYGSHSECQNEQQASEAILAVAGVLDAYSTALGALASNELIDYTADINKLSDEVKKLPSLDNEKVNVLGQLAALIAKASTSAYQQKKIVKFVQDGNDAVLAVSKILADLIETNYSNAITLELGAWESDYKRVENTERDSRPLD